MGPVQKLLPFPIARSAFLQSTKQVRGVFHRMIKDRCAETDEQREARQPDLLDVLINLDLEDDEMLTSIVFEFVVKGNHTLT